MFVGSVRARARGDRSNGMVTSDDPNYPKGFRDSQGIQPEPRVGVAWDIERRRQDGAARERGLYHNAHVTANGMDEMAQEPAGR